MNREIRTERAPQPTGPYSQGVVSGSYVYVAGQVAMDPNTGQVVGSTIQEQTRQTLTNVAAILAEAGLTMKSVIKVTAHLSRLEKDFVGFNSVYEEFFVRPYPVRTTVGSQLNGVFVEVDVVAEMSTDGLPNE